MEPCNPPMTNAVPASNSGWHQNWFKTSPHSRVTLASTICMHSQESKHPSLSEVCSCDQNLNRLLACISICTSLHGPKRSIRWGQSSRWNYRWISKLTACTRRRSFGHHDKRNGEKEFRKMKKRNLLVSLIDLIVMKMRLIMRCLWLPNIQTKS